MGLDVTTIALLALGALLVLAALADRLAGGALTRVPGAVGGTALVGLLVLAAGAVFTLVATDEALADADAPVLAWVLVHRTPGLTTTAEVVSLIGGTTFTAALGLLAALVLALRGRRRAGLIWALGVLVGSLTIRVVKEIAERPRPPVADRLAVETSTSLPSGHALMAAVGLGLAAAAVVVTTSGGPRAWLGHLAVVVAVLAALTIGASRVYLGVHWTTDVTAGWLLGSALVVACVTLVRVLDTRDAPTGSSSPGRATHRPS